MRKVSALLILLCILIASCKNDLDLLADYKETAIIYGVLNQDTAVKAQYIRINKAYLGPGNALQMAKEYDSVNFNSGNLDVKLERVRDGISLTKYTLARDSSMLKDTGVFAAPKQVLFKLANPVYDDSEYRLSVTNKSSGKVYSSKTSLVQSVPTAFSYPPSIALSSFKFNFTSVSTFVIKWFSSKNGRLYQASLRFHYTEKDLISNVTTTKYLDWYLGAQKTQTLDGGEPMESSFVPDGFYKHLQGTIPVNPNIKRTANTIDLILTIAADDLNTFYEVNQPSTGIIQDKIQFSNIDGGLGIFSAKYTTGVYNKFLTPASLDSLQYGQYTKNLGF